MNTLKIWKIALYGFIVYTLRGLVIVPFLNDRGGIDIVDPGTGGLPANVDYFFSATFFTVISLILVSTYLLLTKSGSGEFMKKGLTITLVYFALFVGLDIIVEIIAIGRTIPGYIRVVFIDYTPLFIPLMMGMTLETVQKNYFAKA